MQSRSLSPDDAAAAWRKFRLLRNANLLLLILLAVTIGFYFSGSSWEPADRILYSPYGLGVMVLLFAGYFYLRGLWVKWPCPNCSKPFAAENVRQLSPLLGILCTIFFWLVAPEKCMNCGIRRYSLPPYS